MGHFESFLGRLIKGDAQAVGLLSGWQLVSPLALAVGMCGFLFLLKGRHIELIDGVVGGAWEQWTVQDISGKGKRGARCVSSTVTERETFLSSLF